MGCEGCKTGRGTNSLPGGCKNNGGCSTGGCNRLNVFDWLDNMSMPSHQQPFGAVEVRFKNGRKEYFRDENHLGLREGEVVAVEASPGHDIGTVSLVGELVRLQLDRKKQKFDQLLKVYRRAKPNDIEKWQEAIKLEKPTMTQARKHAISLGLEMKICDVEYQGDKTKATFYYTADGRVDFRELIKIYASEFKIRIEMRQIGARQEAAKLGGVGACGRELCCSSWLTDFRSVSTSAARYQQLSLNPQKLAGQCGKLKCCLNYELDSYLDALQDFPKNNVFLKSKDGNFSHFKSDIFKKMMWFSQKEDKFNIIGVPVSRVHEVLEMNKKGEYPETIVDTAQVRQKKEPTYENVVGQDDLTRFDNKNKKKPNRKKKRFQNKKGDNSNNPDINKKKGNRKPRFNKNKGPKKNEE